jgi:hypothetical protein
MLVAEPAVIINEQRARMNAGDRRQILWIVEELGFRSYLKIRGSIALFDLRFARFLQELCHIRLHEGSPLNLRFANFL